MYGRNIQHISGLMDIPAKQVENTLKLLDEGATIPFISRYRKEMTGSLDEVQIAGIKQHHTRLSELDKRREAIIKSIEDQEKLTPDLKKALDLADNITELEDLYLPFRPKRKTRASVAREHGLEPLALIIMQQKGQDVIELARHYASEDVPDAGAALQGARDIIAEWISEDKNARERMRVLFEKEAYIYSRPVRNKEEEGIKYKDYFEFQEKLVRCPSHRILAMRRGEEEGFLRLSLEPPEEMAYEILEKLFLKGKGSSSDQVRHAIKDSYKRLLGPSIETGFRSSSKERADREAIAVFAENLKQLLLAPPLGQKRILALDPGYRTGCKVVCLDAEGNLLHNETIYPHPPQNEGKMAAKKIASLVNQFKIEAIAIGNGTASRETEHFIKKVKFDRVVQVFMVNESGASIYSASKIAREEFPEYDVTVRGAVSIGRRLSDPLAELVKIDPKSIGVGQYQHDVDQNKLKESLDQVVESCVNKVGVNLNTSSKHLLTYVSGLGPQLAENIVAFRKENGPFVSRKGLKKVSRLGDKAFEQSAGFLRIPDAKNPLDNSAVHPESYGIVEKMAQDTGTDIDDLIKNEELRKKIVLEKYITGTTGLPTLKDILNELARPGRDPRKKIEVFEFSKEVFRIEDLRPGMILPGIVTNITNFGAFVDIGVKQDGLVHISQLADRFVSNPGEVVRLNQTVKVRVQDVDVNRKRIQLSMKETGEQTGDRGNMLS
ncbi:MAG: Tex family protein [Bacteroidales bacterium]